MGADLLPALALLFLGFVLLGVEVVIIPGVGVAGVLGAISLGIGSWLLWETGGPLLGVAGITVSLIASVGAVFWFARSRSGRSLVLTDEIGRTSDEDVPAGGGLVGRPGKVVATLRPSGVVELDGERYDAFLRHGAWLESGAAIRVVDREHGQLVVEEIEG